MSKDFPEIDFKKLEVRTLAHLHQLASSVCSEPGCENKAKDGYPLCVQHLAGPVIRAEVDEVRAKELLNELLGASLHHDIMRIL